MVKRRSGRAILAQNIKTRRARLGWSQEDLAEASELHRTYVGAIEREERNVSIDNIDKIASALSVSLADLLKR